MDIKNVQMLDIIEPNLCVEIEINHDGEILWVHVDGITVLRICRIPEIAILDHRGET